MQHVSLHQPAASQRGDPAWARTLIVAPAAVALLLISGTPLVRRLLHRPRRSEPLASLRSAILGSRKTRVQSILGPPRAASASAASGRIGTTWYYPVENADKLAMAISFEGDRARAVEFFRSPV